MLLGLERCWPDFLSGGGPSPSSAIRDMYSSSILALSPAAAALMPPVAAPPPEAAKLAPRRLDRQSLAMWPAPPQLEQTMLLVTLGLSGHWTKNSIVNLYFIKNEFHWFHCTYQPRLVIGSTAIGASRPVVLT